MPTVREVIETALTLAAFLLVFAAVSHLDYEDEQRQQAELEAHHHAMARCCDAAPAPATRTTNRPGENQ